MINFANQKYVLLKIIVLLPIVVFFVFDLQFEEHYIIGLTGILLIPYIFGIFLVEITPLLECKLKTKAVNLFLLLFVFMLVSKNVLNQSFSADSILNHIIILIFLCFIFASRIVMDTTQIKTLFYRLSSYALIGYIGLSLIIYSFVSDDYLVIFSSVSTILLSCFLATVFMVPGLLFEKNR